MRYILLLLLLVLPGCVTFSYTTKGGDTFRVNLNPMESNK